MSTEIKKEIQLEIAHVLFIDIVGYSKLLINEQRASLDALNQIVRSTDEFQTAEAAGRLIKIPTGDGMALVFYNSPEAPVECALDISRALKTRPNLPLRMGVHSGPVSGVIDVNERANVAGAGINMAQRVMDCGDAGHILLSKRVAEDLEQYEHWQPHLHDLGECEVKHGVRVHIVNLYTDELGNPEPPEKFKQPRGKRKMSGATSGSSVKSTNWRLAWIAAVVLAASAFAVAVVMFWDRPPLKSPRASSVAPPASAIPEKSIAVLPFENLSEEKANAFFADGVQDEILTDLARIKDLKVISRTSVMQYRSASTRNLPEIAQALKVAHVLEGSVQRSANRVRVNAQLIDARNDTHVWAEKYDRDLADVFAIQSEIAQAIADQLQAKLSPKEKAAIEERPTKDLAAYDLYLQAKQLGGKREDLLKAVPLLDQAIARDPAFLLAHCQLAWVHDVIYLDNWDHTESRLSLAETSVSAAVRLQPDSGETHLAQAIHFYWGYLDYDRAREQLAKAESALPNNPRIFEFLGLIDRRQGRWDEAIRNLEHALNLDPRNVRRVRELTFVYASLRKYTEAIAMVNRGLALEPGSVDWRADGAWFKFAADADTVAFRAVLNKIEAEDPSSAAEVADFSFWLALDERDPAAAARALANIPIKGNPEFVPHAWYEGLLAKLRQDAPAAHSAFTAARAEAERIVLAQPANAKPLSMLAEIDAELEEKDKAIHEGRAACDMLPVAKDAIDGVDLIANLAHVYALTDEKDLALERLDTLSKLPGGPSYGELRLDLKWDSLRSDPRFQKIVASLAPKPANK